MNNLEHKDDFIKFLGTAGARFVVARQLRASGGLWFSLGGKHLLVDPGPGSLLRCLQAKPKLNPPSLDGIILTHRHLDHSNDINVMIEAMTNGGRNRKGFVLAPKDAVDAEDPVVQQYVKNYIPRLEYLQEGQVFDLDEFTLETPLLHQHSVETYGLKFRLPYGNVSLIADTAFFEELIASYQDTDILILNVVIYQDYSENKIYHLNYSDAAKLIEEIRPKVAILTHFGMTMLQNKPELLAKRLEETTGVKVIAASDGLKVLISQEIC